MASLRAPTKAEGTAAGYITSISFSAPNHTAQYLPAEQAGGEIMNPARRCDRVPARSLRLPEAGLFSPSTEGSLKHSTSPRIDNKFIGSEPNIPCVSQNAPLTSMKAAFKK